MATAEVRPRPEPTTARGRATRQRIVDAACDLVFERGVGTLSLDDVLAATGTSKSQLYHYFRDKTDLVAAVAGRQGERVLAVHRGALAGGGGWRALRRWRNLVVGITRERGGRGGCPIGSLANELADLDEPVRVELAGAFAQWEALLASLLREMVANGQLRRDANPDDLALATIASLQGGLLLAKAARHARPVEVALDAALRHIESYKPSTSPRRRAGGTRAI
jgi:AcrR family transcriptional regulator